MKCLSIMQPWAMLIVLGAKRFETRTWQTDHRGRLAIHACRQIPDAGRELCEQPAIRAILQDAGYRSAADLPTGIVLGSVDLLDCVPARDVIAVIRASNEIQLGDYRSGRWAWKLANPLRLADPIPMKGQLGLFNILDYPELYPAKEVCA